MKTVYVDSVGLKKGLPVGIYESDAEVIKAANRGDGVVLEYCNKYLVEKGALVEGRDVLSDTLEKEYNFPMLTKQVTKSFKDGTSEVVTMPDETEKAHINRFRAAVITGKHSVAQVTRTGNVDADTNAVEDLLQSIADAKGPFLVDAAKPDRVGKAKTPPKYALEGARNIIGNNNRDKWIATFTEEGIPFTPFNTGNVDADITALAWAIKEREDRKAKREYN